MVNPKVVYCKVNVKWKGEEQCWLLAADLLDEFVLKKMNLSGYSVVQKFTGAELKGWFKINRSTNQERHTEN
jgi:isoleucyl-tRNA synthetase